MVSAGHCAGARPDVKARLGGTAPRHRTNKAVFPSPATLHYHEVGQDGKVTIFKQSGRFSLRDEADHVKTADSFVGSSCVQNARLPL